MADLNLIRKLIVQAESFGFERLTGDLNRLAAAQGDVVKAGQALARESESAGRKVLSAKGSFESLERALIPAAKEAFNLQKQLATLTAAAAQGMDPTRVNRLRDAIMANTREAKEAAKAIADMDREQIRLQEEKIANEERLTQLRKEQAGQNFASDTNQLLGVSRTPATKSGATYSALSDLLDEIEDKEKRIALYSAMQGEQAARNWTREFEESLRIGMNAVDYGATFSALEDEVRRQDEIAKAWGQHIATSSQQAIGQLTGQNRPAATSQGATYSALQEQTEQLREQERHYENLKVQANELLWKIDAAGMATKRLAQEELLYSEMKEQGLITEGERIRLLERARTIEQQAQRNAAGGANRLHNSQFTNLGYQVNDMVTMLASGSSPFQVLATQGGQVYQILQGANGGLVGGFKALGARIVSMITPVSALGAGLVGAAGTALYAWNKYTNELKEVQVALAGVGKGSGATVSSIVAIADASARMGSVTASQARSMGAAFAASGRIGVGMFSELIARTKDYAAATGQDVADAQKELASAFSDPSRGAELLNSKLGSLDATTIGLIKRQQAAGNTLGAQRMMLTALNVTAGAHEQQLTAIGRAWETVKRGYASFMNAVGQGTAPTLDQAAAAAEARLKAVREQGPTAGDIRRQTAAGVRSGGPSAREVQADVEAQELAIQKRHADLIAQLNADQARANEIAAPFYELHKALAPLDSELSTLQDQLANTLKLFDQPAGTVRESVLGQARTDVGLLNERIRQTEEVRAAGSQTAYDTNVAAEFALRVSSMEEYERAIAEVNQEFETLIRNEKGGQAAADTLRKAQAARLEAQRIATVRQADAALRAATNQDDNAGLPAFARGAAEIRQRLEELERTYKGNEEALGKYREAAARELSALVKETEKNAREMKEAAEFELSTEGLDAYAKSIAELNEQFRILKREAAGAGKSTEDLEAARKAKEATAARSALRGAIGQVIPEIGQIKELEAQRDLIAGASPEKLSEIGVSAEQAKDALQRFEVAIRNLKDPIANMIRDNILEVQGIMARTVAEKAAVEAQEAYNAAIDGGRSAAEAAVAAETRRNAVVAQANRQAEDAYRAARNNAALIGKRGYERATLENQQSARDAREQYGTGGIGPQSNNAIRGVVEKYVRDEAIKRGIDPDVAARVVRQESGFNPNAQNISPREKSYGVWQLNTQGGLGATAQRQGISLAPSNWQEQTRFALDVVKRDGWRQWYGARDVGISRWQGIAGGAGNVAGYGNTPGSPLGANDNTLKDTADLKQRATDYEYLQKPIDDANRAIEQQIALNNAAASTWNKTAGEIEYAAKRQELMNGFMENSVEITPQLQQQIDAVAQKYGYAADQMDVLKRQQDAMEEIGDAGKDALKGFISDLRSGKDASEALTNALERMADKLLDMALDSIFSKNGAGGGIFGDILGGIFGGGGGKIGSSTTGEMFGPFLPTMHKGGLVGRDVTAWRQVDARAFVGAPRYHSGFRPNEVPAILKRGEWVLNENDVSSIRKGPANTNARPQMNVQVINNNNSEVSTRQDSSGNLEVVIDAIDSGLAGRASRGKGALFKANSSRASNRVLRG